MLKNWNEDKSMLTKARRAIFVFVFAATLILLLTLVLQTYSRMDTHAIFSARGSNSASLKASLLAAIYFLLLSGYLPAVTIANFWLTKHSSRLARLSASVLLFIVAYMLFFYLFGESYSLADGLLLVAGLMGVAVADSIADLASRQLGQAS